MYNSQLNTFIKVADAGSFSKAAEILYVTPTAIIKQINLLEERLGLSLFLRTHRGLTLTEAGKSIYKDAKYIIKYSNQSIERAKSVMDNGNIIRLGVSPMTPGNAIIDLWKKIRKKIPELKLQLIPFENTPENAIEILNNLGKDIDIVFGMCDLDLLKSRNCTAVKLWDNPITCLVSINHNLYKKENIEIEDLYGEDIMIIRENWSKDIDNLRYYLEKEHPQINLITFDFYNLNVFNQCENNGKILLSATSMYNIHPLLKNLEVNWNYTVPYGIIHSFEPTKIVKKFLEEVKKIL